MLEVIVSFVTLQDLLDLLDLPVHEATQAWELSVSTNVVHALNRPLLACSLCSLYIEAELKAIYGTLKDIMA